MAEVVTIVETPRDAFQGLREFVPTAEKIRYIEMLLDAGVRHIDIGSFVSPKAVPQMADTERIVEVVCRRTGIEFIAIVANEKGVERALATEGLTTLAFPLSFDDSFQVRNTRKAINETWPIVERMRDSIRAGGMRFLVYLSMAFGNPDGETWDLEDLQPFIQRLADLDIRQISLADTIGVASEAQVGRVFNGLIQAFPGIEFSAHFHSRLDDWPDNVVAAFNAGCRRFDGATGGLGGCPFAKDELISNIPTEGLVSRFADMGLQSGIHTAELHACGIMAQELKAKYGF